MRNNEIFGFESYKRSPYFLGKQIVFLGSGPGHALGPSSTKQQMKNHHWFVRAVMLFCLSGYIAAQLFVGIGFLGRLGVMLLASGEPYQVLTSVPVLLFAAIATVGAVRFLPAVGFLINTFRHE